jgi:hypothetical protein
MGLVILVLRQKRYEKGDGTELPPRALQPGTPELDRASGPIPAFASLCSTVRANAGIKGPLATL